MNAFAPGCLVTVTVGYSVVVTVVVSVVIYLVKTSSMLSIVGEVEMEEADSA